MNLMKPNSARRSSSHGIGRDGKPRKPVPTNPAFKADHARGHVGTGIARDGKAKKVQTVAPIHGGMSHVTVDATGNKSLRMGGGNLRSIPDASSASPLDKEPLAKKLPLPKAANVGAEGGRVEHDLGARVLSEAIRTR